NPELDLFNTRDPIALHLSAFGPRTRSLTARLKAGWIDFVGNVETGIRVRGADKVFHWSGAICGCGGVKSSQW
ncbi:MAG: hypothetical protein PSV22_06065, partial [Pseudolabrys sp.]|nr:hypothetical protein [Pseudolabrys sp.]